MDLEELKNFKIISNKSFNHLLEETKVKELGIYWGCHVNISDEELHKRLTILSVFEKFGFRTTLLLADLHTFLKYEEPWNVISKKVKEMKKKCKDIRMILKSETLISEGSNFQFDSEYFFELYHWMKNMNTGEMHNIMKTYKLSSDNLRPIDIQKHRISDMIYPIMQIIDQEHLHCEIQIGNKDQEELFTFYNKKFNDKHFLIYLSS